MGDRRRSRGGGVRVILSYRRSDVGGYAGRLADDLGGVLGPDDVFEDVRAIPPGVDFVDEIERQLERCDAVLAIIGPGWLSATSADGARRLDDSNDLVRLEIEAALRRSIPVVPVLVGGARLPAPSDLPEGLVDLARRRWSTTVTSWCSP